MTMLFNSEAPESERSMIETDARLQQILVIERFLAGWRIEHLDAAEPPKRPSNARQETAFCGICAL